MLFLDCSCLNLSLEIFLDFCDFLSIFRAFKQFLDVFWNCFCIKNKFEKKVKEKSILSVWAEPEGPTRTDPHSPQPATARAEPIWAAQLRALPGLHRSLAPPRLQRPCRSRHELPRCAPI
jgi:hypothetical protein